MKSLSFLAALATFALPSTSLPTNSTLLDESLLSKYSNEARVDLSELEVRATNLPPTCPPSKLFADGSGTWSTSDGDQIIKYSNAPAVHCWNDYFAVDVQTYSTPWAQASGDVYCTGTSSCTHSVSAGTSYCVSTSESNSVTVSVTLAATFATIYQATLGVSYTHSWSTDKSNCNTASTTDSCTWSDQNCHVIYTQQLYYRSRGYSRTRCTLGGKDVTLCMKDIIVDTPVNGISVGCGSPCPK